MVNKVWITRSPLAPVRGGSARLARELLITGAYVAAWKAEPPGGTPGLVLT